MRHNFTLLEFGWLCPALLSLLRSSPQIHSDQNSQTLVRLLNESAECKWPNGGGAQLGAVFGRALRASNPVKRLQLSQKLTQMHEQQNQPMQVHGEDGTHEEEDDDPRIIWSMTVLYACISLMGIVGNILVVVVVQTVPGMVFFYAQRHSFVKKNFFTSHRLRQQIAILSHWPFRTVCS